MALSGRALAQVSKAKLAGCRLPVIAWNEAHRAGIPFHILCAFLEQESSGGMNVFGHDPMRCSEDIQGRSVTKRRYETYRSNRERCGMQGVGPMQLTFHTLQDGADAMGGCWKPKINVRFAAQLLDGYRKETGSWHEAAKRYNGSEAYAVKNDLLREKWRVLLATVEEEDPSEEDEDPERRGRRLAGVRSVTAVGVWLRRHGLTPSENHRFGGVDPVHSASSLHYQKDTKGTFAPNKQGNLALDVNDVSVVDTAFYRLRRGKWRFWEPQSEQQALGFAYASLLSVARKKGWPIDEMFFHEHGFRVETGFDANTPISGHDGHLHVGFQRSRW
jgi:hypothetical protein